MFTSEAIKPETNSTKMTTQILLTILRPTGLTEIVDVSGKFSGMSPELFAKIKTATKVGGKGAVLSYSVKTKADAASCAMFAEMSAQDALARRIENS